MVTSSAKKNRRVPVWLVIFIVILFGSILYFNFSQYLSLAYLKAQHAALEAARDAHPKRFILTFAVVFIAVAVFAIPGSAILMLAGGAVFGLQLGTAVISMVSAIGATCAFLLSRFFLRDWVQAKFREQLQPINRGFERNGPLYLLFMRLNPAFPYFLINYAMGLMPISVGRFWLYTQVGGLPGTIIYVNAGVQIGSLSSLRGIIAPDIILSLVLLSFFPFAIKFAAKIYRRRKIYRRFNRPKKFDFNLIVIGGGAAGLVTSYIAATVKAKVALIEKHKMGGDCLNTGCVPSKALIRTAQAMHDISRGDSLGLEQATATVNFSKVMNRIDAVIKKIEPHDSIQRYEDLGVECIQGEAEIISPYEVKSGNRILTTRNIVIATGARPIIPNIPGLESIEHFTSDTIWNLKTPPQNFCVLGGGPIGCEIAQAFQRLGAKVTLIEKSISLMGREDSEVGELIFQRFKDEGIRVLLNTEIERAETETGKSQLVCRSLNENSFRLDCDVLFLALGRRANTKGLNLEALGIGLTKTGTIETDEFLRTTYPNILACGDVAGPYQFTHTAAHQAWYAAVNALVRPFHKFKADYRVIPWCTFTDPEIARVGLSEKEARESGISYLVSKYPIEDLDRAICDSDAYGFVKVLTPPNSDRILGALIVSKHAGEILAEFVLAMKNQIGLNKILSTIHSYPTFSDANKYAAGLWKKQTAPSFIWPWLEKFHSFRRK